MTLAGPMATAADGQTPIAPRMEKDESHRSTVVRRGALSMEGGVLLVVSRVKNLQERVQIPLAQHLEQRKV